MISGPVFTGTIQCPETGLPILLGPDAQTLGGYPRILQVVKADRHLIGQLRPGDQLKFQRISLEEAEKLWLDMALSFPFLSKI
jgi:allophanate hydrolase subunit 2